ncbi:MAG: hypothetical protein Q9164_004103 [Protoblastenia rupestris]
MGLTFSCLSIILAHLSCVLQAASIPRPLSNDGVPENLKWTYQRSSSTNSTFSRPVPDPFSFTAHGFVVVFSRYEEPSFPPKDTYGFLLRARVELENTRMRHKAKMTDNIPDNRFRYINPTVSGGMRWVMIPNQRWHPFKDLTFQMVEVARHGTARLAETYGTQPVKSTGFTLWQLDRLGDRYIADGVLDDEIETSSLALGNSSSSDRAQSSASQVLTNSKQFARVDPSDLS